MAKKRITPAGLTGKDTAQHLSLRMEAATKILLDKFEEAASQLHCRPVQVKAHQVLEDKTTRDEVRTLYEPDERVDLDALERLCGVWKMLRQGAAMKTPGEETAPVLSPLLALTEEQKEDLCQ